MSTIPFWKIMAASTARRGVLTCLTGTERLIYDCSRREVRQRSIIDYPSQPCIQSAFGLLFGLSYHHFLYTSIL
jgi:hypothetical protein